MMEKSTLVCILTATLLAGAYAYSSGAPNDACGDMIPQHLGVPLKSPPPYLVTLSKKSVNSDEYVDITITGKNAKKFKGFFIQGRVGNEAVGSFQKDPNINLLDCDNGKQNAATHKNSNDKQKVVLKWKSPKGLAELVRFNTTIVLNGKTCWVGVLSPKLTVVGN